MQGKRFLNMNLVPQNLKKKERISIKSKLILDARKEERRSRTKSELKS